MLRFAALSVLAICCLSSLVAQEIATSGNMRIADVPVTTQHGRSLHFYRDLVKGKVVAVNFIFTNCPTICPPMGANYGKLQKLLGDHADRVRLISISIDPNTDTPERLKAWSDQFDAAPGWTLVTGKKRDIETLLKTLKSFAADISTHSSTVLVGNDPAGFWTRANGLASPSELKAAVEKAAAVAATAPKGGPR
ncbi:MAG: SCO family protein [Acidobacteriota bacterium]|nr:SCO family protein [Acidobacteriota bacterium]